MKKIIFLFVLFFSAEIFIISGCTSTDDKKITEKKPKKFTTLVVKFHLASGKILEKDYDITEDHPEREIFVSHYNSGVIHIDNNSPFSGYDINTGIIAEYCEVSKVEYYK